MSLDIILEQLKDKKIELELSKRKINEIKLKLIKTKKKLISLEKTKAFVNEMAKTSQQESIEFIEKIVTSYIQLYGPEWKFHIEVKEMRDQQEFHLYLFEGEIQHYLRDDTIAGGIIDMTSIGIRTALHALDPNSEPILFLDEPFKNVGNKIDLVGDITKELSRRLNMQIVIITHDEELMKIGDTVVKLGEIKSNGNNNNPVKTTKSKVDIDKRSIRKNTKFSSLKPLENNKS